MSSTADHPARPGVLALIGQTRLVRLDRVNPNPAVELWGKVEKDNPGGSIKDRVALYMIEAAEKSGELRPGQTIIEATSGNTGIGLAMVAAAKGYPIVLAMAESVSVERRKILAALGAEFLLTPAKLGTDGAIERAYELVESHPDRYYLPDQFNNPMSIQAHYETTAPEIWEQTGGRITHLVAAVGTTGTLMGCSKKLRELDPRVRIVGVEPYLGHKIQGLKNLKESYVPGIYHPAALDEKVNVQDEAAFSMARRLAKEEGLLVGMSSGAAVHVACEIAKQISSGVIVVILPDSGERYLSTTLYQVAEPEVAPIRLTFLNSLTKRYEPFEPRGGGRDVGMYSCGPTVHARPHLGLLRRMLVDDLTRRALEYAGYHVKHVVSITDLDDNTLAAAEAAGEPLADLCRRHEDEFHEDCRALGMKPASRYVRTSESVDDMVALTGELVRAGFAYEKLHSVYFNIGRVESYGELSGKDLGKIRVGATVDLERYDKDDPRDFTLLRRSNLGEIRKGLSVKTEWGNVRPSWHVQCSAMARAQLGPEFDLHMASADLVFPHNENEIAQSRALTGKSQARVWLHSELVLVGGKKIGTDPETAVTLPDLLARGFTAREVRFFLLQTHYRQPVTLADDLLEASRVSLRRIDECVRNLRAVPAAPADAAPGDAIAQTSAQEMKDEFRRALYDDLNLPAGLAAVFRLVRQANYLMSQNRLDAAAAKAVLAALGHVGAMLGLLPEAEADAEPLPPEIAELLAAREAARRDKDFAAADRFRDAIVAQGYLIEDRAEGTRVRRRP